MTIAYLVVMAVVVYFVVLVVRRLIVMMVHLVVDGAPRCRWCTSLSFQSRIQHEMLSVGVHTHIGVQHT